MNKNSLDNLLSILLVLSAIILLVVWAYLGRYTYDNPSKTSATGGVFFKRTLDLTKYVKNSSGKGLFGKYDTYNIGGTKSKVIYYKDEE